MVNQLTYLKNILAARRVLVIYFGDDFARDALCREMASTTFPEEDLRHTGEGRAKGSKVVTSVCLRGRGRAGGCANGAFGDLISQGDAVGERHQRQCKELTLISCQIMISD